MPGIVKPTDYECPICQGRAACPAGYRAAHGFALNAMAPAEPRRSGAPGQMRWVKLKCAQWEEESKDRGDLFMRRANGQLGYRSR